MLFIFGDNPFKPRTPPHDTPNDLKWWMLTLSNIPFPTFPIPRPQLVFDPQAFSDASGTGIAIIIGQHWHAWHLVRNWKSDGRDITWAESISFELLIQAITNAGASSIHFKVFGDNIGIVEGWPNGRSRNKQVNNSFKRMHATLQDSRCQVITRYVPSENNPADPPSRGIYPSIHLLLPEIQIPTDIQPFLQDIDCKPSFSCKPFSSDWRCTRSDS